MRQKDDDRRGSRSSAQGFQGSQTAAKDFDCVLVWDETTKVSLSNLRKSACKELKGVYSHIS
jgi:hypothetical protein